MKANELRIGNYLLGSKGEVRIVKEINENYYTDSLGLSTLLKHAKPIPLTEEWLLKFGFSKIGSYNIWTKNQYQIEKHPSYRGGLIFFIGHGHTPECVKIKYVLQLQNLYFALTGEELK